MQTPRAFPAVLHMFHDLAQQLATLHGGGYVHRDLKPDNTLWLLQTQEWRLIDFGIAAPIGAHLSRMLECCNAHALGSDAAGGCVVAADAPRTHVRSPLHMYLVGDLMLQCIHVVDCFAACSAGEEQLAHGTLVYSPPEVILGFESGEKAPVATSHDIWALGVMVFEALTGSAVIPGWATKEWVLGLAKGEAQYPWEEMASTGARFACNDESLSACLYA